MGLSEKQFYERYKNALKVLPFHTELHRCIHHTGKYNDIKDELERVLATKVGERMFCNASLSMSQETYTAKVQTI
eukprot:6486826-Amphidinium_carterae.1